MSKRHLTSSRSSRTSENREINKREGIISQNLQKVKKKIDKYVPCLSNGNDRHLDWLQMSLLQYAIVLMVEHTALIDFCRLFPYEYYIYVCACVCVYGITHKNWRITPLWSQANSEAVNVMKSAIKAITFTHAEGRNSKNNVISLLIQQYKESKWSTKIWSNTISYFQMKKNNDNSRRNMSLVVYCKLAYLLGHKIFHMINMKMIMF